MRDRKPAGSRAWNERRQHRAGAIDGFTGRHGIKRMVHIEFFDDMEHAILREGLAIRGFGLPAWRQRLRCR
jgi:hypothetical protein